MKRTLTGVGMGLLLLTVSAQASSGQAQQTTTQEFHGPTLPDFFAWDVFFSQTDQIYRCGSAAYESYIRRLLGNVVPGKRGFDLTAQIIADIASRTKRDDDQIKAEIAKSANILKKGAISRTEYDQIELGHLGRRVALIRHAREELKKAILTQAPQSGAAIWGAVVALVNRLKEGVWVSKGSDASDSAAWKVINSF